MPHKKNSVRMGICLGDGKFYHALGSMDKVKDMATEIEPACLTLIEKGEVNMNSYYNRTVHFLIFTR